MNAKPYGTRVACSSSGTVACQADAELHGMHESCPGYTEAEFVYVDHVGFSSTWSILLYGLRL